MTTTDYVIDLALILSILRTIPERRFDLRSLLLPLGLSAFAVSHYMSSLPTTGNDVVLDVLLCAVGLTLGTLCGFSVKMRGDGNGSVLASAGVATVAIWMAGMVGRLLFSLYANGSGTDAVTRFSVAHSITGGDAWTAALVIMAISQVAAKIVVQLARVHAIRTSSGSPAVA